MNAMVEFPSIAEAQLPAVYEHAKQALSECSRIDECQDWADKAAAMASYAKQAKDDSLQKLAVRIQARAIRRCGELLKQIQPAHGANQNIKDGDDPNVTRKQAASDAGLSERQQKTALRVANVPELDFNKVVDSPEPFTVTQLAEQGTEKKSQPLIDLEGIDPIDFAKATEAIGAIGRLAKFCTDNEPGRIAKALKKQEIGRVKSDLSVIEQWLDVFFSQL